MAEVKDIVCRKKRPGSKTDDVHDASEKSLHDIFSLAFLLVKQNPVLTQENGVGKFSKSLLLAATKTSVPPSTTPVIWPGLTLRRNCKKPFEGYPLTTLLEEMNGLLTETL